jgi:Domain of unknown function (DUF4783)
MYKNYAFFAAFLFAIFVNEVNAQSPSDFFKAVAVSNYSLLESYLDSEVDVCINDDQQLNKKEKAMVRLKNFLSSHQVDKVEPLHTGSSKGKNSEYKVAKLITKQGIFRLFVYSESNGGKISVKEVRIEKFNG